MKRGAVLLMAYGAADSPEDIPAYLADILAPRPVPEALVEQVRSRYAAMGGSSPLKAITDLQAKGLAARLGPDMPVYVGMRHSPPWIKDAVARLRKEGVEEITALPLTPYASKLSVGAYFKKLDAALEETGGALPLRQVQDWNLNPKLLSAYASRIKEAAEGMTESDKEKTVLLLTAHSLPERIVAEGDPYPGQFKATAKAVAEAAGFSRFEIAYQSAGGGGREPWLGPDAGAALKSLAGEGVKSVLLSPIGFVSEHMETLYDDDILYKQQAESLGLAYRRARALNDHPDFLDALAEAVRGARPRP